MADLFDVLAEPTRRDILGLLRQRSAVGVVGGSSNEMSVGELVDSLGITQPTVSKHLKVLRDHGLVLVREDGQHRFYKIASEPLSEVTGWLHTINPTHRPNQPRQDTPPLVDLAPAGYRVGLSLGQLRWQIASLFRR